jgi:hypothetical protein
MPGTALSRRLQRSIGYASTSLRHSQCNAASLAPAPSSMQRSAVYCYTWHTLHSRCIADHCDCIDTLLSTGLDSVESVDKCSRRGQRCNVSAACAMYSSILRYVASTKALARGLLRCIGYAATKWRRSQCCAASVVTAPSRASACLGTRLCPAPMPENARVIGCALWAKIQRYPALAATTEPGCALGMA